MAYNGDDNDYNDRTSRAQISQPSPPDFWTAPEPSTAGGTDDGNFVGLQPSGNSFYVDDDTAWPSQKLSSSSSDASNIPARYFIDDLVRERLSHGPHGEPRPIDTASAAGHADQAAADSWKEPDLAQVSSGSECQPYDMCSQSRSYDDDGTMAGEIQRQLGHEHIEYSGSPIDPDFLLGDEYWFKEPCGESRPSYTRSVNNMACVNAELAPQYREPHTQSQGWTGAGVMQPSTNCGPAVQNNMGYEPREGPWTAFSATNFAQPQSYVYVSRNTTSHGNQTGSFHTSEESWGHVHMGMSSVIDDETTDTSFDPNFDDTMEASGYTARPPFSKPQEQQQQSWASTRSGSEYQDALEADVDMDYQHDRTERRPCEPSQFLPVPDGAHAAGPPSPALSVVGSAVSASSTDFPAIPCSVEDCLSVFRGKYQRGNQQRHMRLKHGNGERLYHCEATSCNKVFKRQDARLKHHRVHHPELLPPSKVSRKCLPDVGH